MNSTHSRLEIRLLGTFGVSVEGHPAGSGGSRRDALLALLALRRGRIASVDALIDDLWGSDIPASPRNALHHHVARLRATLGQDAIVGTPNGYAVAKDATTDALAFEDLLAEARAALRDGDARTAADAAARGSVAGTSARSRCRWSARATSRCCVPSWRSRSIRRLASSPASTIRARDAINSACACAREIAVPTSSVNAASRDSISSPRHGGREHPARVPAGEARQGSAALPEPDPDHAPDVAVHDDRRADGRREPGCAHGLRDGPAPVGNVVDPDRRSGFAHGGREARILHRPAAADLEHRVVVRGHDLERVAGLVADDGDRRAVQDPGGLVGHRGEKLDRGGSLRCQRGHTSE